MVALHVAGPPPSPSLAVLVEPRRPRTRTHEEQQQRRPCLPAEGRREAKGRGSEKEYDSPISEGMTPVKRLIEYVELVDSYLQFLKVELKKKLWKAEYFQDLGGGGGAVGDAGRCHWPGNNLSKLM